MMEEGRFGDQWRPGVADGVCVIPYINEELVPAEVLEKVNARKQEIIDGTFVVEENLVYNP